MKINNLLSGKFIIGISFIVICFCSKEFVFSQSISPAKKHSLLIMNKKNADQSQLNLNYHTKKPGHYTKEDWAAVIDETWGAGLPTSEKLELFDNAITTIHARYAAFQHLDVNLDSLEALYRSEIEMGVSRGRFAAIMNHLSYAMKEVHTVILDMPVNWGTPIIPGIPLLVIGPWWDNGRFGASLTPLPDSSLLIYRVSPNHQLGLEVGDIVLGYDGIPWKVLYKKLLEAQLPISLIWVWGSTDESMTHCILSSCGLNWHLFDTIDIEKYTTGDTVHLSTAPLSNQRGRVWGNEQLEIPGVSQPNIPTDEFITWGIIEGTKIGYLYVSSWDNDPQLGLRNRLYDAIDDLMHNHETTGLIIDFRLNYGGGGTEDLGYLLLFNSTVYSSGIDIRSNANDHFAMQSHPYFTPEFFVIHGDIETFYDKPIAVLIGPASVSAGDFHSMTLKFHPMTQFFGKPTCGAFCTSEYPDLRNPDWVFYLSIGNGYLVADHRYLTHTGVEVDEEVWLTSEDVVKGEDTVVKAAMQWIQNLAYAHDITVTPQCVPIGTDTITINASVENPNQHILSVLARIQSLDNVVIDSTYLVDDGLNNDGASNDGFWGRLWSLGDAESIYRIEIETKDLTIGTSRILPNIAHFTTIGPVTLESFALTAYDTIPNPGDQLIIGITLRNDDAVSEAENITVKFTTNDTSLFSMTVNTLSFGNIAPHASTTRYFPIRINDNCSGNESIHFNVDIKSHGINFWKENFTIQIKSTGIYGENVLNVPKEFILNQNYPNPFNSQTTIHFYLPNPSEVSLIIYDIQGRLIRSLSDSYIRNIGWHSFVWDGKNDSGSAISSGIYFYQLKAGGNSEVKKLLLIK